MFIELVELLRCPNEHEGTYCVLSSHEMEGHRVVSGTVGCPVCKAEYQIVNGIVGFGDDPLLGKHSRSDDLTREEILDSELVAALLSLETSGGFVVLIGSVTRLAQDISKRIDGVGFVGINPPPDVVESSMLSLLRSSTTIPLESSIFRGAVVGKEYAEEPWLGECTRVLAKGARLVVGTEDAIVSGVRGLAAERGIWVGEKDT